MNQFYRTTDGRELRGEFDTCASCKMQWHVGDARIANEISEWRDNQPYCANCVHSGRAPLTYKEREEKSKRFRQAERARIDAETRKLLHGRDCTGVAQTEERPIPNRDVAGSIPAASANATDAGSPDRSDGGYIPAVGDAVSLIDSADIHRLTSGKLYETVALLPDVPHKGIGVDRRWISVPEGSEAIIDGKRYPAGTWQVADGIGNNFDVGPETAIAIHPKGEPVARDCDGAELRVGDWVGQAIRFRDGMSAPIQEYEAAFIVAGGSPQLCVETAFGKHRGRVSKNLDPSSFRRLTAADGYYAETGKVVRGAFALMPPEVNECFSEDPKKIGCMMRIVRCV